MMLARLQYANALRKEGVYEWRAFWASLSGFAGTLTVLAALQPGLLPDFLLPYHPMLVQIGKWALIVVAVAGGVLSQTSEKVIPKLPASPDDDAPKGDAQRGVHDTDTVP